MAATLLVVDEELVLDHWDAAGNITPAPPSWTFNPDSRTLTLAHATLGTSELEFKYQNTAYQQYTAALSVDAAAHPASDWKARVKAALGRDASQPVGSPAIDAASTTQPLVFTPVLANFGQSAGISEVQPDGHLRRASFAELEMDTNASAVTVRVSSNADKRTVTVLCDGDFLQAIGGLGTGTWTIQLPGSGTRRLKLIEGAQDRDFEEGSIVSTTILDLTFAAGTTSSYVLSTYETNVLGIGDSIINGADATNRALQGWAPKLRNATRAMSVSGYGSHTATFAFGTLAERNKRLAEVTAAKAKHVIISLGTNDLGYAGIWTLAAADTPANMAAGIASYLDAQHLQDPDVVIYISLILERYDHLADGQQNALGFGRIDYNNALRSLQTGRDSYVRIITLRQPEISTDKLHPTTAGQQDLFEQWNEILGGPLVATEALVPQAALTNATYANNLLVGTAGAGQGSWSNGGLYRKKIAPLTNAPLGLHATITLPELTVDTSGIEVVCSEFPELGFLRTLFGIYFDPNVWGLLGTGSANALQDPSHPYSNRPGVLTLEIWRVAMNGQSTQQYEARLLCDGIRYHTQGFAMPATGLYVRLLVYGGPGIVDSGASTIKNATISSPYLQPI